ncbi:MAG: cation transporting ATPase C-terminal domain-containing protein, partial [Rhodopila sp.]
MPCVSLLLQGAVVYIPLLQQAFSTVGLNVSDWLICVAVASSVLWVREFSKLIGPGSSASTKHR